MNNMENVIWLCGFNVTNGEIDLGKGEYLMFTPESDVRDVVSLMAGHLAYRLKPLSWDHENGFH